MNRNLMLNFGIVFVALLIPYSVLQIGTPTLEWSMFWQVRTYLVNYSGIVSMILMSLCVILSVKHWPLER
ncbi:MAG: oxidoreductase, partial [Pseudomonadota bacterium]